MAKSSPDDFREEIEEDVAEGQEFIEDAAQEADPPELADMESMAETAEADVAPDVEPEEAPFIPEIDDPPISATPLESEGDVAPPELDAMADMAETAADDIGSEAPEVEAMADMAGTAAADVPPTPTQTQQVKASIPRQQQHQFEMDFGAPESSDAGMESFEAMSRERDVTFMWQRLVTQKIVDHTHMLEQLLAMLERER